MTDSDISKIIMTDNIYIYIYICYTHNIKLVIQ